MSVRKTDVAIPSQEFETKIFKCRCGCLSQLMFVVIDKKVRMVEVNTRDTGRHKWQGVILEGEEIDEIKEFFKSV